jgi:hypothetical protein
VHILLLVDCFAYIAVLLKVAQAAFDFKNDRVETSPKHLGFQQWLYFEMYGFVAMILCYTIFLMIRSFTKHKLLPEEEVPAHKRLPVIDTLLGLQMLADMFVNSAFPFAMSCLMYVDQHEEASKKSDHIVLQILRISTFYTSALSFFFSFCHIFVSWKDGPQIWTIISPYFMISGAFFNYVILPCVFFPWIIIVWIYPGIDVD